MEMNLIALVVLLALAWFAFDAGMTFFAFLMVLGAVLLLFTEGKHGRHSAADGEGGNYGYSGAPGQPIVIESPDSPTKSEVRLKVKKWKDRWNEHPHEYMFEHFGIAVNNIGRSILYMFGMEKDE